MILRGTDVSYTGYSYCNRCGEMIPPHRILCDICRGLPDEQEYNYSLKRVMCKECGHPHWEPITPPKVDQLDKLTIKEKR